jgi:hypothetical protein
MQARLIALVCGVLAVSVAPAVAAPTQEQLAARAAQLEKQLSGQGYTVVVEAPFVVIGDESPKRVKQRAAFVHWIVALIEKDYFAKQPDKIIDIWLFRNQQTYRKGAKKFWDDEPTTPYGYYSPEDSALIMNIGPGAGTLSHELVHPYIEANFPDGPSWFNEGLASLYEQPREKDGHMWGTTNWRLPGLQAMIKNKSIPSLRKLMSTTRDGFYDARYDSYAYARFLCQYLQDHGKLIDFYKKFTADTKDLTGQKALAAVVGMEVESFDAVFQKWAMSLRR